MIKRYLCENRKTESQPSVRLSCKHGQTAGGNRGGGTRRVPPLRDFMVCGRYIYTWLKIKRMSFFPFETIVLGD